MLQQRVGVHDHARRAVAALEAAVFQERALKRAELALPGEPLDRRDLPAFDVFECRLARAERLAVRDHGAGAADPGAAAVLGAGEREVGAQHPEQRAVVLGLEREGQVVVKDGLAGGEILIVRPGDDVTDGVTVRVKG